MEQYTAKYEPQMTSSVNQKVHVLGITLYCSAAGFQSTNITLVQAHQIWAILLFWFFFKQSKRYIFLHIVIAL